MVAPSTLCLAQIGSFHDVTPCTTIALEIGIDFNLVEKDIWFWLDIFLSNVDLLRFGYYRFRVGGNIPTNKKVVDMYDVEGFVAIQFFSHHLFLKIVLRSNWLHKGSYTCWSHQFSHAEEIRISEQGLD